MKKIIYLLIILAFITKINAQFIGHYNMRDGGVDMPSSQLYVLPENEFVIFHYAGYISGKWKKIDESTISLTETKTKNIPITLHGIEQKSDKIKMDVYGLHHANAFIKFSIDTSNNQEFQPVFNDFPNCIESKYVIEKKHDEYNWVTITIPTDPTMGRESKITYPYKAFSYTFPLNKKYSVFKAIFNEYTRRRSFETVLTKNGDSYAISNKEELERKDLEEGILEKIKEAKIEIDKEFDLSRYGDNISTSSISEVTINKPTIKPLFTSQCDNENIDIAESE